MRRRPAPVNTSIRCAGLVLASLSVTILNLTAQVSPQALRSRPHSEGDAGTPLTLQGALVAFINAGNLPRGRPVSTHAGGAKRRQSGGFSITICVVS
jgi:hypothetical protein